MSILKPILRTGMVSLLLLPTMLLAQSYPSKPITLVVPFAPGGGTDSIARDVARSLSEKLGQPVIVDNKGGGGGSIGANTVAKAQADGYTLLFATSTFITNVAAQASMPYNVEKDFAPISMIGRGHCWLWRARIWVPRALHSSGPLVRLVRRDWTIVQLAMAALTTWPASCSATKLNSI